MNTPLVNPTPVVPAAPLPVQPATPVVPAKSNAKLFLALAILFFIISVVLAIVLVVDITQPKSDSNQTNTTSNTVNTTQNTTATSYTTTNTTVVQNATSNEGTTPVETAKTYTFSKAYGFNVTYDSSMWEVAQEPLTTVAYNPNGTPTNNNELILVTKADATKSITVAFSSAVSGMLTGNPTVACTDNYYVVTAADTDSSGIKHLGLARLTLDNGDLIYAKNFYLDVTDTVKLCAFTSHPFYKVEKVEGGEFPNVPDTNDIYWIASVKVSNDADLAEVDKVVSTMQFGK